MNPTEKQLRRLMQIDALLASSGVVPDELATEWGVDTKTVRRCLDAVRAVGIPMSRRKINKYGKMSHVYADRRHRLFRA